jgi:DNA-binding NtrC family response regulator
LEATLTKSIKKPEISQKALAQNRATILVVDDDILVVDLLKEYLIGNGHDIITAASGEEALLKIRSVGADLALVDLKMPGMDGLETIERMAESDPDTVTILITGYPTLDSSVRAIRLGASDYILKPFKLEDVNTAVGRAIKERSIRLEVKNLRSRMFELEKNIIEKKDSIKVNKKLGVVTTSERYATKALPPDELSGKELKSD